jgi:hypothetical protein
LFSVANPAFDLRIGNFVLVYPLIIFLLYDVVGGDGGGVLWG